MIAILIIIYLDPSFQAVRGFFALPFKSATVGVAIYLINNKIIGFWETATDNIFFQE